MINIDNLTFVRHDGRTARTVLNDLSFQLSSGSQTAIVGDSGAGKTTLLRLIGGLEPLQQGKIVVNGIDLGGLNPNQAAEQRSKQGVVFQDYQLLSTLTARDNISISTFLSGQKQDSDLFELLTGQLGITELLDRYPQHLSGGEQQRVAIARALIHKPQLVLADEPTGNLDQANSNVVGELLVSLCKQLNTTLVIATHSLQLAQTCQQTLRLNDGKLVATQAVELCG